MKTRIGLSILFSLSLVGALLLGVSLGKAQEPQPSEGLQPMGEDTTDADVAAYIPIQGRLTDASGNPINGNRTVTFRLYDVQTGGTAKCTQTATVTFNNGVFNSRIYCTSATINGQMLYIGITVEDGPEMTPRQPIFPVPYAWSLRPGAIIKNTTAGQHTLELWSDQDGGATGTTLWVRNTNTGNGIALWAIADGTDTTFISSNDGGGPIFKGFGADGGEHEFIIYNDGSVWTEGDVSQDRSSDGLVKAGAHVYCAGGSSYIIRSFNNIEGTISMPAVSGAGKCAVDFGFKIDDRYFSLSTTGYTAGARGVSYGIFFSNQINIFRWKLDGTGEDGNVSVLVY